MGCRLVIPDLLGLVDGISGISSYARPLIQIRLDTLGSGMLWSKTHLVYASFNHKQGGGITNHQLTDPVTKSSQDNVLQRRLWFYVSVPTTQGGPHKVGGGGLRPNVQYASNLSGR